MSNMTRRRTWQEIAAEAYKESDPQKLLDLTAELERALDERDKRKAPQNADYDGQPRTMLSVGRSKKINRDEVLASLATTCPNCGYRIQPAEIKRVSFDEMECPACGATFNPTRAG